MPKRSYSGAGNYRYGFNGKENDNDVKGLGNQQDYGMRIYDPRIGRFLSMDPLTKHYPQLTPFQFASNRPIDGIDLDGLEYLRSNKAKITVNDGRIFLNIANLREVARLSYLNANEALGGVRTWTDKNGTTYIGSAIPTEIASFSFDKGGKSIDPIVTLPGLINPSDVNDNLSDAPADPIRLPQGRDINGNPLESAPSSSPSKLGKGFAKGILAIDISILALQKAINGVIESEVDVALSQLKNQFSKALQNVVDAANEGLIKPQYLNTRDLSSIVNVVLSGVNNTDNNEIYEIGKAIYDRNNPPTPPVNYTPKGLDFMQNIRKVIPEIKTKETKIKKNK